MCSSTRITNVFGLEWENFSMSNLIATTLGAAETRSTPSSRSIRSTYVRRSGSTLPPIISQKMPVRATCKISRLLKNL